MLRAYQSLSNPITLIEHPNTHTHTNTHLRTHINVHRCGGRHVNTYIESAEKEERNNQIKWKNVNQR